MIDEATARAIAIILAALGIPALIASLGRSIWKWWTGRAGRERGRNNDLVSRLHRAERHSDMEAVERRLAMEYASRLRRQLIENGIEPTEWPESLGSLRHGEGGDHDRTGHEPPPSETPPTQ